jgi:predicted methyltransferase
MKVARSGLVCFALLFAAGCGGDPPPAAASPANAVPVEAAPPTHAEASAHAAIPPAVVAADRDPEDVKLDAGRHPTALVEFCGVQPGMRVAEIAAGGGYTAEVLARAVGPKGAVYGVNNRFILEKFAEKAWSARLAKPVNKNVVRVDRELDDPLPPEAKNLDVVVNNLFYHDTYWMKTDRDKMNKAVFAALKPGGVYCVLDHSGKPGTGAAEVQTLHRIEEKAEREDVEKAGFKLAAEGKAWRNPADTRDWNTAPFAAADKRGTSDRFALKFVRP